MSKHQAEVQEGHRFEFGANWARFLQVLDDDRIQLAEDSLKRMLGVETLSGQRFIDVGSGSGLFSLVARRLGATVHSFDYDPQSVACTKELKRRYFPEDVEWVIEEGSILNTEFLDGLGQFDVVYSWGVLHHTGSMWEALENAKKLIAPGGRLSIAIYNDQGRPSKGWMKIKMAYNRLPKSLRWIILFPALLRLWGPRTIRDIFTSRPFDSWRNYSRQSLRGMSAWHDVVDWVGGLPFEVAKPEEIFDFYHEQGYRLDSMRTCAGGIGCNEFVFTRLVKPQSVE